MQLEILEMLITYDYPACLVKKGLKYVLYESKNKICRTVLLQVGGTVPWMYLNVEKDR